MEKITRDDIARIKAEKAQKIKQGQQLYAKIKRNSKYAGQAGRNEVFPVYIVAEEAGLGLPRRRQRASVADLTGANTAQPDLPDELPPGVTWQ
mgnify:CR=1 FL=1